MNTYFLEFHNWNLHLPIYHLQICLFFVSFGREGGQIYCGLLELSVNFSLFKYCEQSKNREPILCKKKKNTINLKVSAYACFIKIKQRK